MAFSSNDMSAPFNIQVTFPEETSQIGNPNLIDDDIHGEHGQKLKELMKHMFSKVRDDSFEGLVMIDAVQRLGIDYYFKDEISEILQKQYMFGDQYGPNNLQEVALRFRLLRAEGYYQSPDIFNKYKNKEGKFNKNLSEDINGLMSLYEASQLSIEGEDVLDEAEDFIAKLFNECMEHLDNCQATVVKHIFAHPYRKSLFSSFMAKNFAPGTFQGEYEWLQYLQQLAKMDFNMNQSLHRLEIVHISKWWKDLGLAEELKFARDQPVKWYIWSMACFTDPRMSWQRIDLTKPISLVYIIDDIFDVYGSLEELTLFTETVNRWDLLAIDRLPDYMKLCFEALNNITNEISCKVYKIHGHNPVQSLRKAWASLCNAFLVEARWFASGHLPKAEEYLKNGIISSGVNVGLVHVFFLLGEGVTKESVQLIDDIPAIISSIATILRLWDDLGSAKDENQNGKDGSYINYYMNEHQDSTSEEAQKHAMKKISEAWKNLNKACLCSSPFSATFKRASLNVARMVPLMYSYDENQRLPSLETYIRSLFETLPTQGVY